MRSEEITEVLNEHIRLCSDLRELLMEEGRIMRSTGAPPSEAFLNRKREFIPAMERGIALLKAINDEPEAFPRGLESLVENARATVMKIMILDRENERLLLKSTLPPKMKDALGSVAPGRVAKAYSPFGPKKG